MQLPKFKPSNKFLGDIKLACLTATIKYSRLPGVAHRHVAEFEDDGDCVIYLRGKDPKKVSPWHQKVLDQLFTNEGLAAAVNEAMKEYQTTDQWGGKDYAELSREDRAKIRKHGIAPYVFLHGVVIDELQREVILCGQTIIDGNLDEHGISIYLKKGHWHFDASDYYTGYLGTLEESHPPTARELRAAQTVEVSTMAAELAPGFESFAKSAEAWEKLFPQDPQAPVDTSPNFLYGDWQFDEGKTRKVRKSLGQDKAGIEAAIENSLCIGRLVYRISPTAIAQLVDGSLLGEDEFCGSERRGNRVIIHSLVAHGQKKIPTALDYWCDGQFLIDWGGSAFKRL